MSEKLTLKAELAALDHKQRDFYDTLDDVEQKKFSPYLMLRYSSAVQGSRDLQTWYLLATNERVNVDFFQVNASKHKKLQWLLCTTASPQMGAQRHYWVSVKKRSTNTRAVNFLTKLYPELKIEDCELLAELNTKDELVKLAKDHGWDDSKIRSEL